LKYRALGDLAIFLCFGPLLVEGTYYIQTDTFSLCAFLFATAQGLLTEAILHVNNTRDREADRKGGAFTLAQILHSDLNNLLFYAVLLLMPNVLLLLTWTVGVCGGGLWVALGPLLLTPMSMSLISEFKQLRFDDLCPKTAQFGLLFGLSVCLSLLFVQ